MADDSHYYNIIDSLRDIVDRMDNLNANVLELTKAIRSLSDDKSKIKKKEVNTHEQE